MRKSQALAIVIILMMAGFALRLYQIDTVSFRGDEAFTILNWVRQPFPEVLQTNIPTSDPQPPLAYALFHYWGKLFGDSEFSMRVLPAFVNVLGVAVMYALGHFVNGRRLGVVAALFWAVHPFEIWHSQDARNYAIWGAFSATAIWLALRAMRKGRRLDWVLYVIAATATAYVYYLELFVVAALNLYAAYRIFIRRPAQRQLLIPWAASQIAIALLLVPWFLQERLLTGSGYGGTTGRFDLSLLATQFLSTLTFGSTLPDSWMPVLSVIILFLVVAGGVIIWRRQRDTAILLFLLILTPTVLLALVSLRLNVFTPRYILGIVPALLLLIAIFLLYLWDQKRAILRGLAGGILALILIVNVYSLSNYYWDIDYTKSPPWREVTAYLHSRVRSNDVVINASSDIAFKLYYGDTTAVRYLPANPIQPPVEIEQVLDESQQLFDSLWAIGDPTADWENAPVRDNWLNGNMQQVRSLQISSVPIREYLSFDVNEAEFSAEETLATFGDFVELRGAEIIQPLAPETDLNIRAYWQPLTASDTPLKMFVHLTGSVNPATGSPLWSQDDQFPQDGRISTVDWTAGQLYRDIYLLPLSDLPPGNYTVVIGLYAPETGQRILTDSGADSYTIGSIDLP